MKKAISGSEMDYKYRRWKAQVQSKWVNVNLSPPSFCVRFFLCVWRHKICIFPLTVHKPSTFRSQQKQLSSHAHPYTGMLAPLTMLFTASANPGCDCSRVGSESALTGRQYRGACHGERGRGSLIQWMDSYLWGERIKMKAGGEDALPQWTTAILTWLLLHPWCAAWRHSYGALALLSVPCACIAARYKVSEWLP